MSALGELSPAERHRVVAAGFTAEVAATTDWSAPSPVPEWSARDVVAHLVDWFPTFLAAGGVNLPAVTTDDPEQAWAHHAASVQALLDGDDADRDFTHPYVGTSPLRAAVDRFYTADVFMHTWDLAQAGGRRPDLDPGFATELRDGLSSMEEVLRSSGQYGPAYAVPDDADPVVALAAFIGRDPSFVD
ncbi:maleylpyruvate isomerase family mycothiol-dependent enzyme [Gordonia sp. HY442]|uniref:maleylpyruvate isomerase family mycothiol-dependent enzyme n=1 Tax=Gordonia zhenghanii TaxID=2911516 RepID=UPI001EFFA23C|nr:maleylpyruvate isomerase family mycothiol-dependent enzyme [Gordonia zhenghanii]MCF8607934.1 maleylpyruvate isomerase family mycothiol-dependent enzyme [Gordonia zhenghanii]